jgi:hypothetical protein
MLEKYHNKDRTSVPVREIGIPILKAGKRFK